MQELIVLCSPEDIDAVRSFGLPIAVAAWRWGDDGRLWRLPLPVLPRDSFMAVFGGGKICLDDMRSECARLGISEILWFADAEAPAMKGYGLYAPRSTAICGGSLADIFAAGDCAIIEPSCEYFTRPGGVGEAISDERLAEIVSNARSSGFSVELGCKYAFTDEGCALYDDAETVAAKLDILRSLGVERAVLPYREPAVREFLQKYR